MLQTDVIRGSVPLSCRTIQSLSGYLSETAADEAPDGHLGSRVGLRKGSTVLQLKLEAGDVQRAEELARETGCSFDECIKIYSDINILNTPSYLGGELIAKAGGAIAPSAQAALRDHDFAAAAHASAVRGGHGVDVHVTKAQLDRATTQCHLEMVKAARSRPIAYGDLGVINMMRQGRP